MTHRLARHPRVGFTQLQIRRNHHPGNRTKMLCSETVRWDELDGHQGSSEVLGKGGERDVCSNLRWCCGLTMNVQKMQRTGLVQIKKF